MDEPQIRFDDGAAYEQMMASGAVLLGLLNAQGIGGPRDDTRAKAYYEMAAAAGNAQAKEAIHRIDFPQVLKDKNGKILTHLCF